MEMMLIEGNGNVPQGVGVPAGTQSMATGAPNVRVVSPLPPREKVKDVVNGGPIPADSSSTSGIPRNRKVPTSGGNTLPVPNPTSKPGKFGIVTVNGGVSSIE